MSDKETSIIINGKALTTAQVMTVRTALGRFAMDLRANGFGDDEAGQAICASYLRLVSEINHMWGRRDI